MENQNELTTENSKFFAFWILVRHFDF